MRKLVVFALIVSMFSCKEKEEVETNPDHTPRYVGSYYTKTAMDTYSSDEQWVVTKVDKNILGITYKVVYNVTKPVKFTSTETYTLKNVMVKDSVTIVFNENADLDRDGTKGRAKVEGTGKRSTANGLIKVGIIFKITDLADNKVTTRELLEFKKN
jgi:hypothetical protein